jgi:hypothetical protein
VDLVDLSGGAGKKRADLIKERTMSRIWKKIILALFFFPPKRINNRREFVRVDEKRCAKIFSINYFVCSRLFGFFAEILLSNFVC